MIERDGVTLERRAPQDATPAMPQATQPQPAAVSEPEIDDAPFVPEVPEQPVSAPRMPSIEDFPAPGQAEYRAHKAEQGGEDQSRRPGFFERIASGLGRRDDDGLEGLHEAQDPAPAPAPAPIQEAAPRAPESEFAKPARPAQYESQVAHAPRRVAAGAAAAPARSEADDEYEIPAFLRRQSN